MSNSIEVLYAPALYRRYNVTKHGPCLPVVRYADFVAALEEKEQLRAAAVRRCDELIKQLERMALVLESDRQAKLPAGRW